jgi:hypothetical protein
MPFRNIVRRLLRNYFFFRAIDPASQNGLFVANKGSVLESHSGSKIVLHGHVRFGFLLSEKTVFLHFQKQFCILAKIQKSHFWETLR